MSPSRISTRWPSRRAAPSRALSAIRGSTSTATRWSASARSSCATTRVPMKPGNPVKKTSPSATTAGSLSDYPGQAATLCVLSRTVSVFLSSSWRQRGSLNGGQVNPSCASPDLSPRGRRSTDESPIDDHYERQNVKWTFDPRDATVASGNERRRSLPREVEPALALLAHFDPPREVLRIDLQEEAASLRDQLPVLAQLGHHPELPALHRVDPGLDLEGSPQVCGPSELDLQPRPARSAP